MTPWLDDGDVRLYHGDALERLREMPSESVQCIVTSPPFWGLRDYGTGSWSGGDADCDHLGGKQNDRSAKAAPDAGEGHAVAFRTGSGYVNQGEAFGATCGKCGARRVDQQIGLEDTPDEWCAKLVAVMREARRVLRSDGVCWLECGDTYASSGERATGRNDTERETPGGAGGSFRGGERAAFNGSTPNVKPKDLVGAPWLLAFALRADGWYLRSDTIWARPNPMPESVTDRPTKAHSYVFLLTKSARYFYDADAIREAHSPDGRNVTTRTVGNGSHGNYQEFGHEEGRERWPNGGRNARSVWSIPTESFSASALGGGISYKASADCPTHGLHADPEAWQRAAHGAQPAARTLYRIDGTDARRALGQPVELASTPHRTSEADSSATPHSTQSRRTGLAQSTTPPCTPCGETTPRTAGTLDPPGSAEPHASTTASSTDSDDSPGAAPLADTPLRTARKCSCEKVITDHFATFPQALVERCIKAGSSERGACSECGAPWRRITDVSGGTTGKSWHDHADDSGRGASQRTSGKETLRDYKRTTTGWEPSCDHFKSAGAYRLSVSSSGDADAGTVPESRVAPDGAQTGATIQPCVVLDPFMGSGTTALVARRLGRHATGIELNAEYLQIAATRLQQLSLLGGTA